MWLMVLRKGALIGLVVTPPALAILKGSTDGALLVSIFCSFDLLGLILMIKGLLTLRSAPDNGRFIQKGMGQGLCGVLLIAFVFLVIVIDTQSCCAPLSLSGFAEK